MTYSLKAKETQLKVAKALHDLRDGKMVILTDSTDRENEGDVIMAAEHCTMEAVNFMIKHCRGLVCVPLEEGLAKHLQLPPMWIENTAPQEETADNRSLITERTTRFSISVDHKNCTTGISAYERSLTITALAKKDAKAIDFVRPGHVFPLIAHPKGLAARQGHTEASLALLKKAELTSVGVICEIINDDGTMARRDDLEAFARKHQLHLLSIEDILDA